jgi:hypothetical protein
MGQRTETKNNSKDPRCKETQKRRKGVTCKEEAGRRSRGKLSICADDIIEACE